METISNNLSYLDRVCLVESRTRDRIAFIDQDFQRVFETDYGPRIIVRAPGRVELLGNHTDYNDGITLSTGINKSVLVGARENNLSMLRVYSINAKVPAIVDIDPRIMERSPEGSVDEWTNYVKGVISEIQARFGLDNITPCDLYIESDIPPGAGFSSSAALELALAKAIIEISHLEEKLKRPIDTLELIKIAQAAETGPFVLARTGFLDQSTSAWGNIDFLDFKRPITNEPVTYLGSLQINLEKFGLRFIVATDHELKHNLAASGGGYNKRVLECSHALTFISRLRNIETTSLRQLAELSVTNPKEYTWLWNALNAEKPILAKRVRHVVTEMIRVSNAYGALLNEDLVRFGKLMNESGKSSLDDYDIGEGVPELRWTINKARRLHGVLGVRNMGGGFNNTVLLLIKSSELQKIQLSLQEQYGFYVHDHLKNDRAAELDFIPFATSPGIGILKAA